MQKYKGKYRNGTARLQSWDYRNPGGYYITICTASRIHFFGHINNGIMCLNEIVQLRLIFGKKFQIIFHISG